VVRPRISRFGGEGNLSVTVRAEPWSTGKDGSVVENLISALSKYPLVKLCFETYIRWVFTHDQPRLAEYDLIDLIQKQDEKQLGRLESLLKRAMEVLELDPAKFIRVFGFTNDLLTADPEKVHDILAEPLFVVDLDEYGFSEIEKLPNSVKRNATSIPVADFLAVRCGQRFAIELKTIRTESWAEEGKPLGDASKPAWWLKMFYSNARTKIEDNGRRRGIIQLKNTREYFNCQATVLALYTRRLGPSTLMSQGDYRDALKDLHKDYPCIDFLACKNYFADVVLFEPELPVG